MSIRVVRGSVIDQQVDALVNAANTTMRGGSGVDGAIHHAAGPEMLAELKSKAPKGCKTGEVVVTPGFGLGQKWVIHTPGPMWNGGNNNEPALLASCYKNSLQAADGLGATSIAFCSISTGIYGYPLEPAATKAITTVKEWVAAHPDTSVKDIVFAMFTEREFDVFDSICARLIGR